MKKSQIVRYSSEELKQLPSESDWEANAAMSEEEIRSAIASDADDAELDVAWLRANKITAPQERFDVFILVYDEQGKSAMRRVDKLFRSKNESSRYVLALDETGKTHRVPVEMPENSASSNK